MVCFATLGLQPRSAAAQTPLTPSAAAVPPLTSAVASRRLDLNVALSSGYDLTMAEDTRPGLLTDPRLVQDTASSGLTASLAFTRRSRRVDFGASGGGNLQYYTAIPKLLPINYYGGASGSARLGQRTQLRVGGGGSYSPYYSFGDFLTPRVETISAPRSDMNIARLDTYTANTSASLASTLTKNVSMDVSASADMVDTSNRAYSMLNMGARTGVGYRTTQYSQLRLGYGYRRSQGGGASLSFELHNIDAGFAYGRPLSFSRRTVVAANTGTAVITYAGTHSFAVIGNASLTHQLTRRSALSASYYRDVSMFAGFTRPFISDVVSSSLSGSITKDLGYDVIGSYALGRAMIDINNGFTLGSGTGRLRYQVTRFVPLFAEYSYYHYRFERPLGLEDGFPLLAQHHGLRAGVSYSLPVVGRRMP